MASLRTLSLCGAFVFLSSCAIMHQTQVGEVDSAAVLKGKRFEVLVSQTGFSVEEAGAIAASTQSQTGDALANLALIISLFQMGPRTGNPVYNDAYAKKVFDLVRKECPSGRISGLMSVRETNKYPVVSGEIVKIAGYCAQS